MKLSILILCFSGLIFSFGKWTSKKTSVISNGVHSKHNDVASFNLHKSLDPKVKVNSNSSFNAESVKDIESVVGKISYQLNQLETSDFMGNEQWFEKLQHWIKNLNATLEGGSGDDLLKQMDLPLAYHEEFYGRTDVSQKVLAILYNMHHLGPAVTRVIAVKIESNNGVLDESLKEFSIKFFGDDNFHDINFWTENELPPLSRSGVFIALYNKDYLIEEEELKKLGAITTSIDVNKYFRSYAENGDGMKVLKKKFYENRLGIEELYKRVEEYKTKNFDHGHDK